MKEKGRVKKLMNEKLQMLKDFGIVLKRQKS